MRNVFLAVLAAVSLISGNTESKWTVSKGPTSVGTITLLTSASGARAEWRAPGKSATEVFLGSGGKVWLRATGGDVDLATISALKLENMVAWALLLPDSKQATYSYDAKGANKVEMTFAGQTYTLTRTSLTTSNADASNFAVRPRRSASSRLARLSGDLLGPSDTSVAATAGGRGVGTKGLKLNDGGDYGAVEKLENRDTAWKEKLSKALTEFQKNGKIGKSREDQ
ncbi:MAG: hypothetical protein M3041_12815 [Acidobacteriota bacterium]|nr:hypothetical protein [Acidobacteriota bacterium]